MIHWKSPVFAKRTLKSTTQTTFIYTVIRNMRKGNFKLLFPFGVTYFRLLDRFRQGIEPGRTHKHRHLQPWVTEEWELQSAACTKQGVASLHIRERPIHRGLKKQCNRRKSPVEDALHFCVLVETLQEERLCYLAVTSSFFWKNLCIRPTYIVPAASLLLWICFEQKNRSALLKLWSHQLQDLGRYLPETHLMERNSFGR